MQLKIEYLPKTELKPYANNAKLHTGEQVEQIKKSIRDFGFDDPVAVWGDNEIVEGHGRLLAVMEMDDIDIVPVIRLDHLTEEQRRAYTLVHNKLTMNSGYNHELMDFEIDSIDSIDLEGYGLQSLSDDIDSLDDFFNNKDESKPVKTVTCPFCNGIVEYEKA